MDVQEFADIHAVESLIHRYADSVTRAAWDETEAVFAADAAMEIGAPFNIHVEGARAIREYLVEATTGSDLLIQTASSVVVRLLASDRATATSTIHELSRGVVAVTTDFAEAGSPVNFEQYGVYYDTAVKTEGDWKLSRRFFQPVYAAPDVLTGHLMADRNSLADHRP